VYTGIEIAKNLVQLAPLILRLFLEAAAMGIVAPREKSPLWHDILYTVGVYWTKYRYQYFVK
jgi:hypothetical protein